MNTENTALQTSNQGKELSNMFVAPDFIKNREDFLTELNQKPDRTEKTNGQETIPVSFLETLLDETYLGLWQTSNFRHQVIANEIVGTLDLSVFDPTARIWITRSGSAAVMIRQTKDSQLTDIGAKIKNGLMMDFPKLETMCFKAACKRLGKKFGRDLNRKFEDEYETVYSNKMEIADIRENLDRELQECKTSDDLLKVWNNYDVLHDNPELRKIFNSYKLRFNITKNNAA